MYYLLYEHSVLEEISLRLRPYGVEFDAMLHVDVCLYYYAIQFIYLLDKLISNHVL